MKIGKEEYFEASQERLKDAISLYRAANHDQASYAACLYISGLAVECLARAYRAMLQLSFDDKHDIRRLFSPEIMEKMCPPKRNREFSDALNTIYLTWLNKYRYAPDNRLEALFKSQYQGTKIKGKSVQGSYLKFACMKVQDAMHTLFNIGVIEWKQLKK